QENLYFIHNSPNLIPNSVKIDKNMYWGGDFEKLTYLLNNHLLKDSDIRFFLGYSGWSVDQLKEELNESSWVVIENKYPNLLQVKSATLWKNQLMAFGGEYQIWANAPKNPSLN